MRVAVFSVIALMLLFGGFGAKNDLVFASPAYASSSGEDETEATPEFEYFQMDPLMIPIIQSGGIAQQVSFVISIEVPYGKLHEISLYQPRLADAYIQDLYGVLGAGYGLVNGRILDVRAIKKRLSHVTKKVLGDKFSTDVLLQVVQQRPL